MILTLIRLQLLRFNGKITNGSGAMLIIKYLNEFIFRKTSIEKTAFLELQHTPSLRTTLIIPI